jgi:hypothetical protein
MGEDTWLELILSFVTSDERQTLRVPARDQRAEFGENAGYGVADLQRALAACDPNNFKRFRQNNCFDPVALRVIALDKLTLPTAENAKTRKPVKPEVNALHKPAGSAPDNKRDKAAPLPLKEGHPDKDLYAKFPEKSLRRRLWDTIVAKRCVRCNGEHLRSACTKERQGWEDDFEKSDFWTRKAPAKQVRVQLSEDLNMPSQSVLHVVCSSGICLIDTCSDVSLARRDVLRGVREADIPVVVNHLGGETRLTTEGAFTLESREHVTRVLPGVFAVSAQDLPAGVVALLGLSDVRQLGLSLDAIADHPGCHWEDARLRPRHAGVFHHIRRFFSRCCPPFAPSRRAMLPPAGAVDNLREEDAPLRESYEPREGQLLAALQNRELQEDERPVPRQYGRLPQAYLQELKAKSALQQRNRTVDRIGRLFLASPSEKTKKCRG